MAKLVLPSSPSTPTDLAVTLLSQVYAQHISGLEVSTGQVLSLSTLSTSEASPSLSAFAKALLSEAGKSNDALGSSDESKTEVISWLDKIGSGAFEGEAGRATLDKELSTRTYLSGSSLTAADMALYASLAPYVSTAPHSALLSHPSLTRHFDHVQNSSLVFGKGAPVVSIDVKNVPVVPEPKPEPKVKKAPADVAAAVKEGGKKEKKDKAAPAPAAEGEKKKDEAAAPAAAGVEGKKGEKKEKKPKAPTTEGGKKGGGAAAPPVNEAPAPWMVDLKVGKIVEVALHPDADSLYVEKIDVGEAEPRTVVSGLVKYIPIEQMLGKTLITVCNLKPANMRGVKSFAMVLCASSKEGKDGGVEFVDPPAGSLPGDRVFFEGFEEQTALELLNPKKKIFETVQPGFTTLENKEAAWVSEDKKVHRIVTSKGVCTAPTFVNASLS